MAKAPEPPFDVGNIFRAQRLMLSGGSPGAEAGTASPEAARARPRLRGMLRVMMRRRQWGLLAVTVVMLSTFGWVQLGGQQFEAKGSLLLSNSVGGDTGRLAGSEWQGYISTVVVARMGRSRDAARRAQALMKEWAGDDVTRPGVLSKPDDASARRIRSLSSAEIASLVSVDADIEASSVEFTARHGDPLVAAYAVQAVLTAVREHLVSYILSLLDTRGLEAQAAEARRELLDVEREIARLQEKSSGGPGGPEPASLDEIRRLDRSIAEARAELRSVEERVRSYRERLASPEASAPPVPEFLLKQLLSLRLLLEDYLSRYTEEHPKVKKLRRRMASVRKEIDRLRRNPSSLEGFPSPAADELRSRIADEQARKAALEARIRSLESARARAAEALSGDGAAGRLRDLEHRRKALREMVEEFQLRTEKMKFLASEISRAGSPASAIEVVPVRTRLVNPASAGLYLVALIFGVAAAFGIMGLAEVLDPTVLDPERVEETAGAPLLRRVPLFREHPFVFPENRNTPAAAVFARLRDRLRYAAPGSPEKLLAVTSCREGEGASFCAVNLAISFAQEGEMVALVDADLRPEAAATYRDALVVPAADDAGLLQFLQSEDMSPEQVVKSSEMANLFVVPSGGGGEDRTPLFRSPRFGELLRSLAGMFDVVVLSCPAVLSAAETSRLAASARSTVLVCAWGETPYRDLEEAARLLRSAGARLRGVVANKAPRNALRESLRP